MRLFYAITLSLLSFVSSSTLSSQPSSWVNFTNTSSALSISTPLYTLSLSSSSGTLLYLLDGITKSTLFYGSGFGQLWALVGPSGSVNNNALPFNWQWVDTDEGGGGTLRMVWARAGGGEIIQVNVTVLENMRFFDITFELVQPPIGAGIFYDSLWFPSMPLFNGSRSNVFFPLLPGVTLNSSFFDASTPINIPYPGSGSFAEFLHVNTSESSVSIFTLSGPNYTIPHMKGLYPVPESGQGLWRYAHSIQPINVTGSCDPLNGGWVGTDFHFQHNSMNPNPCALGLIGKVMVRIAVNGSALDDILLYGVSNGFLNKSLDGLNPSIAAPYGIKPFLPIETKVNSNLTLLRSLARSTLVKVDAIGLGLNFSAYATDFLPILSPLGQGLLYHTCAWEPIAFDHFYPDLLPPNKRFGTGCDLADAHSAMASAGHLTMPYSNPTWWDPTSPTLSHLPSPLTLNDVSSLNSSYQPIYETYPDKPPATGIVTELNHPFVTARIRALLCQLDDRLNWPECINNSLDDGIDENNRDSICNESAVRLHDDIIFEDQLGARNAYADYHPNQGGLGALGFQNAIERHAENVTTSWGNSGSGILLGTEQGYDRLATTVIGFFGNAIELNANGYPFFSANWTLTPLSSALFGSTILYNVHNLATSAFALSLENACWALASGSRLSIDGVAAYWSVKAGNNLDWLSTIAAMQRIVASQWTGYSLSSFIDLYENGTPMTIGTGASKTILSRSSLTNTPLLFPSSLSYSIVTNWANEDPLIVSIDSSSSTLQNDTFLLPPRSCLAYGSEQDVIGGWVSTWRGGQLEGGNNNSLHFVIEDRNCSFNMQNGVCLHHGLGPDTDIYILPVSAGDSNLQSTANFTCIAVSQNSSSLGTLPCSCNKTLGLVNVQWNSVVGGKAVDFIFIPNGEC